MVASAQLLEMLRAKAMLLLRREREVYQLRRGRDRTKKWLDVFAYLSVNVPHEGEETLLERWVASMVDSLAFQVAAAYRMQSGTGRLTLLSSRAHRPLQRHLTLTPELGSYLATHPVGHYTTGSAVELDSFAEAVGLGSFFWMSLESQTQRTLLVSGFAPNIGRYNINRENDLDHFIYFTNHLGVLIRNALLIEQLAHESSELHATNTSLDRSLTELREMQRRLIESSRTLAEVSRRAGMADVATGVIHNVGNALNSVNVSLHVARERLRSMQTDGLSRAGALLVENGTGTNSCSTVQCGEVSEYLKALASHLEAERRAVARELDTLGDSVRHISAIVAQQQTLARAAVVSEHCDPADLFVEALGFVRDGIMALGISVHAEVTTFGLVQVDRHKVVQILVNLLTNAQHALAPLDDRERAITIRAARHGADRFIISVQDNGVGIPAEHRTRVFSHGFTTRAGGHGFGLPASAIAAQELGGALSFESLGPGHGATFTLELPVRPVEERAKP